jgi:GPH family glycoside/pentoside/hexuronide:cation symporter
MSAAALTWGVRWSYGLPAFALAVVGIPIYVYLPKFYSDTVGIDIATVGTILLCVRLFDAVSDPVIGLLSDRTRSRFGRRRPYILIGGVGVAAAMYFLFTPPASVSYHTLWFAFWIFTLFAFWTLVTVPYESLGPEICFEYTERTTLFAVRDGLLIAGTLMAAAAPTLVATLMSIPPSPAGEKQTFFWLGVIYAPILIGTCGWCVYRIREQPPETVRHDAPLRSGWRSVWQNRPFMILIAAYTVSAIGSNLPATLLLYYVEYVLQSSRADLFLLLYLVSGVLCLPAWIALARRIGKKRAWLLAMMVNTGIFLGVFLLGPGDELLYGLLVIGSGLGFGASLALPSAIQADVIDYDELLTGLRREGRYIGLWSIAKKLAAAAGVGIGLTLLGSAGYSPNSDQPEAVIQTLRYLYALVPCLCNLIAIGIIWEFPLDAQKHADIRSAIEARRHGRATLDPLRPGQSMAAGSPAPPPFLTQQ